MYVHIMRDGVLFDNKYPTIIYQQLKFSRYYLRVVSKGGDPQEGLQG